MLNCIHLSMNMIVFLIFFNGYTQLSLRVVFESKEQHRVYWDFTWYAHWKYLLNQKDSRLNPGSVKCQLHGCEQVTELL